MESVLTIILVAIFFAGISLSAWFIFRSEKAILQQQYDNGYRARLDEERSLRFACKLCDGTGRVNIDGIPEECFLCWGKPVPRSRNKDFLHQTMRDAANAIEELVDGGCDHGVGICECSNLRIMTNLRLLTGDKA